MNIFEALFHNGSNCIGGSEGQNCLPDTIPTTDVYIPETDLNQVDPAIIDYNETISNDAHQIPDHFQSVDMDREITSQRMGGSDVKCDNIIFQDEHGHIFNLGDFTGKEQLWSGGVEHFDLKDAEGNHISFTKNTDGTIVDFKILDN
jgi:hypothetical protein